MWQRQGVVSAKGGNACVDNRSGDDHRCAGPVATAAGGRRPAPSSPSQVAATAHLLSRRPWHGHAATIRQRIKGSGWRGLIHWHLLVGRRPQRPSAVWEAGRGDVSHSLHRRGGRRVEGMKTVRRHHSSPKLCLLRSRWKGIGEGYRHSAGWQAAVDEVSEASLKRALLFLRLHRHMSRKRRSPKARTWWRRPLNELHIHNPHSCMLSSCRSR